MTLGAGVVLVSFAAIGVFLCALHLSALVEKTQAIFLVAQDAVSVMLDAALSDDEKEAAVQSAATKLLGGFFVISAIACIVLAPPAILILIADIAGIAPLGSVSGFLLSWEVIIGSTVLFLAVVWIRRRW